MPKLYQPNPWISMKILVLTTLFFLISAEVFASDCQSRVEVIEDEFTGRKLSLHHPLDGTNDDGDRVVTTAVSVNSRNVNLIVVTAPAGGGRMCFSSSSIVWFLLRDGTKVRAENTISADCNGSQIVRFSIDSPDLISMLKSPIRAVRVQSPGVVGAVVIVYFSEEKATQFMHSLICFSRATRSLPK